MKVFGFTLRRPFRVGVFQVVPDSYFAQSSDRARSSDASADSSEAHEVSIMAEESVITCVPPEPGVVDTSNSLPPTVVPNGTFVVKYNKCSLPGTEHELQDAEGIYVSSTCLLAAVADGVTHSFRPKTLADRLVGVFTGENSPTTTQEWQQAWEGIRAAWYKEYSPQFTTFHSLEQSLFVDPGCHSTFHGVRVDLAEDGQISVQALRRGDAIALWIDEKGALILSDPDVSFGNHPETLGLDATKPNWDKFHVAYDGLPARNLILATDALADYLLAGLSKPDDTLVDDLLGQNEGMFEVYCKEAKKNGLKPDDYAYIVVRFADSVAISPMAKLEEVVSQPPAEGASPPSPPMSEASATSPNERPLVKHVELQRTYLEESTPSKVPNETALEAAGINQKEDIGVAD